MAYILALDQGTTSSRALIFDHAGTVRAVAQQEFGQIFPRPGWVEHDATEIWATQSGVLHEALAKAGLGIADIAAIGITNQRETTVLWDRATGHPLANAIVWQDRRTAQYCDELRAAGHAGPIAAKTGLVVDAYFSGTKLKWLLDHLPGARERAARGELAFGTIDSWLIWNLSGGRTHVTDASNASRTMLFNLHTGRWDDELLALFDIPRAVLPEVVPSSGVCAEARLAGVTLPIAGIAGDQQAALFGQACHAPGLAKNTYGTGCFLLLNTGSQAVASANNLLTTVAWLRDGRIDYALEGSVFIGGAVVQWLRGRHTRPRGSEAGALSLRQRGCCPGIPALAPALGPTPPWQMTWYDDVHARAALDAIALQSAECWTMQADSEYADRVARRRRRRCQQPAAAMPGPICWACRWCAQGAGVPRLAPRRLSRPTGKSIAGSTCDDADCRGGRARSRVAPRTGCSTKHERWRRYGGGWPDGRAGSVGIRTRCVPRCARAVCLVIAVSRYAPAQMAIWPAHGRLGDTGALLLVADSLRSGEYGCIACLRQASREPARLTHTSSAVCTRTADRQGGGRVATRRSG
jgi:glycerol kinase